jgi:hypothetical protein
MVKPKQSNSSASTEQKNNQNEAEIFWISPTSPSVARKAPFSLVEKHQNSSKSHHFSLSEKHRAYTVTSCHRFVTTNTDFFQFETDKRSFLAKHRHFFYHYRIQ